MTLEEMLVQFSTMPQVPAPGPRAGDARLAPERAAMDTVADSACPPEASGMSSVLDMFSSIADAQAALPRPIQGRARPLLCRQEDLDEQEVDASSLTMADLSSDQRIVYQDILSWLNSVSPGVSSVLTMGGFAGSGKTTLLGVLANEITRSRRVAFCAYTGKAAGVLRRRLAAQGVRTKRFIDNTDCRGRLADKTPYVNTIHSLIYHPETDAHTGKIIGWVKRDFLNYELIVVDEASMVDHEILADLKRFGLPILAVGDHGQLPPVNNTDGSLGLMERPDVRLENIHRQAAGNPIIALSKLIREQGGFPRAGTHFEGKDKVKILDRQGMQRMLTQVYDEEALEDVVVLTYTNRLRQSVNAMCRRILGREGPPVVGDQVVCLRNMESTVFNGMRGIITSDVEEHDHYWYGLRVAFADDLLEVEGSALKGQFEHVKTFSNWEDIRKETGYRPYAWADVGMLLDYGYALTGHKMQGSQAKNVFLCIERPSKVSDEGFARWAYTCATRSTENLYLVSL